MRIVFALGLSLSAAMVMAVEMATTEAHNTSADNTVILTSDFARAKQFHLTPQEWEKYRFTMQGPRGVWSPDLNPIWVLGIHADTEAERARYAELAAHMEHERVEAELAFQVAYDQAMRKLYPQQPAVDVARMMSYKHSSQEAPHTLQTEDRLLFFTKVECDPCASMLTTVLSKLAAKPGIGLDLYFVDGSQDDTIRAWAKQQRIPLAWVTSRRVTLNHDHGKLAQFAPVMPPYLVRQRGKQYQPITLLDLLRN